MRTTRIHVDAPLHGGTEIDLPEGAAGHLVRVLRLGIGDRCVLFNGDGLDYPARLIETGKRSAKVMVDAGSPVDNESPLRVILLQSIARGEKMDLILQKATEMGIAAIHPAWSQRSEVKLDAARADKRLAHWRSVVVSACEQSGRACVPEVSAPLQLTQVSAQLPETALRLTLDPEGAHVLGRMQVDVTRPVVLAIGPEGGWSPTDLEHLRSAGFEGLRLGPRILRTETAGLAAIAALQGRFGDYA